MTIPFKCRAFDDVFKHGSNLFLSRTFLVGCDISVVSGPWIESLSGRPIAEASVAMASVAVLIYIEFLALRRIRLKA